MPQKKPQRYAVPGSTKTRTSGDGSCRGCLPQLRSTDVVSSERAGLLLSRHAAHAAPNSRGPYESIRKRDPQCKGDGGISTHFPADAGPPVPDGFRVEENRAVARSDWFQGW